MTEFNISVIYLHYCHKSNIFGVFVLHLRILPVTSQAPKLALPLREVKFVNRPAPSGALKIKTKHMPMIRPIYYVNGHFKCKMKHF